MTTQEVAARLYELCNSGQYETAQQELYSVDAYSTEKNMAGEWETVHGMEAIIAKGQQFREMTEEIHGGYVKEPLTFGNHIFMEMGIDMTMKGMGRMEMKEMAHYVVADGKIVGEQFFY